MLINACRSEWKKFFSVTGNYVLLGIFFFISIGGSIASVYATKSDTIAQTANFAFSNTALNIIGAPLIIALSTLIVTAEYRNNSQQYTLMMTPNRTVSAVSKLIVSSVITGVVMSVASAINLAIFHAFAQEPAASTVEMGKSLQVVGFFFISGLLISALSQGLGYMMRNTAGVITLLIVLYSGLEGILGILPKVRDSVGPYFPLNNLKSLWSLTPHEDVGSVWWALAIVAVWSAVSWIAGLITLNKRDA